MSHVSRQEYGDWQTPAELAQAALARVGRLIPEPATVLETSCGEGSFLVAASRQFGKATLVGYELNRHYVDAARSQLPLDRSTVHVADFFDVTWERVIRSLQEPILVTGNPPWVTNAALGSLGSGNLPAKQNFKGLSGLEAMTGKSNFDVSEWMILRLLAALQGHRATLAVLCKTAVARRVIEFSAANRWDVQPGSLWRINAAQHFGAAVDAALFVCMTGDVARLPQARWPVHASLDAARALSTMAVMNGTLTADTEARSRTAHVEGVCSPEWRSGLKHDCSRVMELRCEAGTWRNGLGDSVRIETEILYPFLKSSDVANGVPPGSRAVIVPQHALGEDTSTLRRRAPKAWAYLTSHRELLAARKSSIYRGQPDFAIFGIGPYSFAPWKVAISGLYKRIEFALIGPHGERPVMLDDTCYFLPFDSETEAREAHEALRSDLAHEFIEARVFWDAKRPINKSLLQRLDLHALLAKLGLGSGSRRLGQTKLAV